MSTANLIKMANQIAQYFASEPDQQQAVLSVRNHMQMYWTPAMRYELMVWHVDHHGDGLHSLVRAAVKEEGKMV